MGNCSQRDGEAGIFCPFRCGVNDIKIRLKMCSLVSFKRHELPCYHGLVVIAVVEEIIFVR